MSSPWICILRVMHLKHAIFVCEKFMKSRFVGDNVGWPNEFHIPMIKHLLSHPDLLKH